MNNSVSPAQSATVVLLRDRGQTLEVLMLQKNQQINFGGSWVFPGGVVEEQDYALATQQLGSDDIELTAKITACRETAEETGLSIDANQMHVFAHWVTPKIRARRYATWFFVANANGIADEVKIDDGEIVQARWLSPQQALQDHAQGIIELNPPAFVTLSELAKCANSNQAVAAYQARETHHFHPRGLLGDGFLATLYQADSGYELISEENIVSDPEAVLNSPAPRHRLVMPKTGEWHYIDER